MRGMAGWSLGLLLTGMLRWQMQGGAVSCNVAGGGPGAPPWCPRVWPAFTPPFSCQPRHVLLATDFLSLPSSHSVPHALSQLQKDLSEQSRRMSVKRRR